MWLNPFLRGFYEARRAQDSCSCLLRRVDYVGWMDGEEQREALKVPDVDSQHLRDAVNIHARRDPGIVNLHAPDFLGQEQLPPTVMDIAAFGQQLKIPFDYAGDAVRLANAQSESVPVERTGGSIPKLARNLRGKT